MRKSLSVRQVLTIRRNAVHASSAITLGILMASVTLMAGVVKADILYDTTWMTDTQAYSTSGSSQSFIGGFANLGTFHDMQNADDFIVPAESGYNITSVTGDYLTLADTPPITPNGGILVEFFSDQGGSPSDLPTFQILATGAAVSAASFVNQQNVSTFSDEGIRFEVDLSNFDIELGAGTWWVSIQPVDETEDGLRYYQVSETGMGFGSSNHFRNGGTWHGNGYGGTFGENWDSPFLERDLAFAVEGTRNPAPACSADLDQNGAIDVSDLLILLTNWGADGSGADIAEPLDIVDIFDLLDLLAAWGDC